MSEQSALIFEPKSQNNRSLWTIAFAVVGLTCFATAGVRMLPENSRVSLMSVATGSKVTVNTPQQRMSTRDALTAPNSVKPAPRLASRHTVKVDAISEPQRDMEVSTQEQEYPKIEDLFANRHIIPDDVDEETDFIHLTFDIITGSILLAGAGAIGMAINNHVRKYDEMEYNPNIVLTSKQAMLEEVSRKAGDLSTAPKWVGEPEV